MADDIDFLDVLKERAASGKPIIVIEPGAASEELCNLIKNTLPECKKHHVQYINLDGSKGLDTDTENK